MAAWLCATVGSVSAQQITFAPPPQPISILTSDVPLPMTTSLNSLQGAHVAEIQIKSLAAERSDWLEPLLVQKTNEPLDKYKVRQSVQALYNTGLFAVIQVEAERKPSGEISLVFNAKENFFFGSILVQGAPEPLTGNQLVNASKLTLGEQFSEDKINTGILGMQSALQSSGYYKASIQADYEWDAPSQQVKVLFVVTRGEHAHIGHIKIGGSPGFSEEEVLDTAKMHPGDPVSQARVNRAIQKLRGKYQKANRLEAQVAITRGDFHPENNTLDYTFEIARGPVVEVRVEGASMSDSAIKKSVPIYEEGAVDDDLINEARQNIRDYFQTKGYFDAEVEARQQVPSPDRREVIFDIDRGELHRVDELEIKGNKYFPYETVRERMEIQRAGGLQLHGLFSQAMLQRDIHSIESLYRDNGFLQVKVTGLVQDDYKKEDHLKISIDIEEGQQVRIGKLIIQGNSAIPDELIRNRVSTTEGQPYSESSIRTDQREITNYYFNRGFPNVRFEPTAELDPKNPALMNVTYKVTEGSEVFVDKIYISGLRYTKGFVVDRQILVKPGLPLSQEEMLDSQRQLYDMGLFNAVDMAIQNPDGEAIHKSVNFQVAEARRYTFNYGLGFEVQTGQPAGVKSPQGETGASARVSFDVTRLNFRGRDHVLTLQTRYGNLQKRALIGYEAPRLFDSRNLTLNLTAFYDDTFDVSTFEAKRLEGEVSIKQVESKSSTFFYRLTYRRVSTSNLVIDPNLVPLFSQPVRVGIPSITYIRDTRDDPTDSHKGSFSTIDTGAATGFLGSQANFGRVLGVNSTYYQFHKKRWVFARSTRLGVEQVFKSTDFIPLPERFLAGGANSHRGFAINQAGPRDLQTGFPLGGEVLFLNNMELRTPPLPLPFTGNDVSAVVFHDMGNVFATPKDAVHSMFRFSQPNRAACQSLTATTCDFNYISHAVGGGIRYRTPIGPVSVDLGYNLNPPAFPIKQQNRTDVAKHFNFFIGIGQTF
ncbi:MAG TPA: outer membrane protein assembly factor BamA [Candidatus Angelobacter sp.]|nr:outer membrane protein assembly factor BamA [Candidatus Angelobacter sp.]